MSVSLSAAHGLRFHGLGSDRWLAATGAEHWPLVSVERDEHPDAPELAIDGAGGSVRIRADVAHAEIVHPLLGRVAGQLAIAGGADAMHAGAVVGPGGAWAVLGPKMAGKSTLLGALARAGTPVVTDDVLVFADGRALAGPRCIDLRAGSSHLAPGVAVRPTDARHRMALPEITAEHPLVGVIHLEWSGSETAVHPLHHRESIARLLALQGEKGYPRRPGSLLDLAALPTLRLCRPRSMSGLDASVALVARVLAGDEPHVRKIHRRDLVALV